MHSGVSAKGAGKVLVKITLLLILLVLLLCGALILAEKAAVVVVPGFRWASPGTAYLLKRPNATRR